MFFDNQIKPVNEVYFGKTPELQKIEKQLGIFRNKYMGKYVLNMGVNSDPDLIKFDRMMEDYFGFGCFTMKIINEPIANGFTYPIDYRFDNTRDGKDLIADKKGFKFKKEYDYACLMYSYAGIMFNPKFTDGECMAMILHEVGHNFNCAVNRKRATFTDIYITLMMIIDFINTLSFYIPSMIELITNTNAWRKFADSLGREWREDGKFIILLNDICKDLKSLIKAGIYELNDIIRVLSLGTGCVSNVITYIFNILYNPVSFLFGLILLPSKYRNERFADNFATMYGYGPETVSLQTKLDGKEKESGLVMKNIDKIPLISTIIHTNELVPIMILTAFDEHPEGIDRCMDQLKLLKRELAKEDLDPKMKKVIAADIKVCEQQIDKFLDLKDGIKDPYLAKKVYSKFLASKNNTLKSLLMEDKNKFDEYDKRYNEVR